MRKLKLGVGSWPAHWPRNPTWMHRQDSRRMCSWAINLCGARGASPAPRAGQKGPREWPGDRSGASVSATSELSKARPSGRAVITSVAPQPPPRPGPRYAPPAWSPPGAEALRGQTSCPLSRRPYGQQAKPKEAEEHTSIPAGSRRPWHCRQHDAAPPSLSDSLTVPEGALKVNMLI